MAFGTEQDGGPKTFHIKVGHGKQGAWIDVPLGYETDRDPRAFTHIPRGIRFEVIERHFDKHYPVRWKLSPIQSSSGQSQPTGEKPRKIGQYEGLKPSPDIGVPDWLKDD
jgi:hypothetical protein